MFDTEDVIRIRDLNVYAYHGVFAEEQEKGQNFYVNADLYTSIYKAGLKDDLILSTNYGEVCAWIHAFMISHTYMLIESVVERMARELLVHFPLVLGVKLEVRKPEAPVPHSFSSISVMAERKWNRVYIGLGSNMGDKEGYLKGALDALEALSCMRNVRCSQMIGTKPYGGVCQDDFLNAVVELETFLPPYELLEQLHVIEQAANRTREIHWGPRTLDLDILFYGDIVMSDPELVIPHPDMKNRDFVLKPLSSLNPYLIHPVTGQSIQEMLDNLERKE